MKDNKHRSVNTKFWERSYIISLNPVEKLLFLYLLTNPITNLAGIYEISMRRIEFDTGIDKGLVIKTIEKFQKDNKLLYHEGFIILLNFYRDQSYNSSMKTNVRNIIEGLPEKIKKFVLELSDESIKQLLTSCKQPVQKLTTLGGEDLVRRILLSENKRK